MSKWCESCGAGCLESSSALKQDSIVAVRTERSKEWVRSKVVKIVSERYGRGGKENVW